MGPRANRAVRGVGACLVLVATSLAACTDAKAPAPATTPAQEREIREANRLPKQQARAMASPYRGLGCVWPLSLQPARIATPNAVSATCNGMPQGKPYEILVSARIPAEIGEDSEIAMRLRLEAPGARKELTVTFERRIGEKALFSGKAKGQVPNSGAVPATLSLIDCVDRAKSPRPCILDSGSLFVLSRR
jgi:hypothetical protein